MLNQKPIRNQNLVNWSSVWCPHSLPLQLTWEDSLTLKLSVWVGRQLESSKNTSILHWKFFHFIQFNMVDTKMPFKGNSITFWIELENSNRKGERKLLMHKEIMEQIVFICLTLCGCWKKSSYKSSIHLNLRNVLAFKVQLTFLRLAVSYS